MPGVPRNLEVLEITTESFFIAWSPPLSDGGSEITDYRIRTEDIDTFEIVPITFEVDVGVSNITFNITGLAALSPHNIEVAAINIAGRGPYATTTASTLSLSMPLQLAAYYPHRCVSLSLFQQSWM